jgi:hypothetical protein
VDGVAEEVAKLKDNQERTWPSAALAWHPPS